MPANQIDNYDYKTAGFDQFLNRRMGLPSIEMTEDVSSLRVSQLSSTSLVPGITSSQDGKLKIDWAESLLVATDGARNRVEIGKLPGTNQYGIRIYDAEGNIVIDAGGNVVGADFVLEDGMVTTDKLADLAVTAVKIANLAVTNAKIASLSADKLTTGTLSASTEINVGANYNKGDGINKRIIINDGADDRILIGYQSGGF